MKHLSESIVSKKTGMYKNVENWNTKDQIVKFLETNGYTRIDAETYNDIVLVGNSRNTPVYSLGVYNGESVSHWIKFYNPILLRDVVFFCREKDIMSKIKDARKYCTIFRSHWSDFRNFEEFRKFVKGRLGI